MLPTFFFLNVFRSGGTRIEAATCKVLVVVIQKGAANLETHKESGESGVDVGVRGLGSLGHYPPSRRPVGNLCVQSKYSVVSWRILHASV